jgi:adenine/guanine phosphoribosyltransferase-like PRPP-binding protein
MCAAEELVRQAGAEVGGMFVVIELEGLDGKSKLRGELQSLLTYPFDR